MPRLVVGEGRGIFLREKSNDLTWIFSFFVVSRPTPAHRSEPREQPPILVRSRSGQWSGHANKREAEQLFFAVSRPTPAEAKTGNSHQSSSDPGLVRVRPALGHCFAYNTVRSEQHGGFKLPFSWDEGDGTGSHDF